MDELLDNSSHEEKAGKAAMGHMFECYEALRGDGDSRDRLALHSRLFALQYVALEEYFPQTWE